MLRSTPRGVANLVCFFRNPMEALILVAENGSPTMLPRIGVMKALNRHRVGNLSRDGKRSIWAAEVETEAMTQGGAQRRQVSAQWRAHRVQGLAKVPIDEMHQMRSDVPGDKVKPSVRPDPH
jgi:hypothetical protein